MGPDLTPVRIPKILILNVQEGFMSDIVHLSQDNRSVLMLAIAINKRKKERPRGAKKRGRGRADDFSKYP